MKILKYSIILLLLIVVIGGVVLYLNLNRIVRSTVQSQATDSLNLTTTLDTARLSLFGGRLSLGDLQIASPQGFGATKFLSLDKAAVKVNYSQLRSEPIHISQVTLRGPRLVVEQAGGKFNIQAVMDQLPKSDPNKQLRLVIDKLDITDAAVTLRPGIPGLAQEMLIPLPAISVSNIGQGEGAQNGAAIKDVVMQVVTTMAAKASDSDKVPPALKQILNLNVDQIAGKLGAEFNKQIGKNLPGDLGKLAGDVIQGGTKDNKDSGKAIEKGLEGLLGGKKPPATRPAGQ